MLWPPSSRRRNEILPAIRRRCHRERVSRNLGLFGFAPKFRPLFSMAWWLCSLKKDSLVILRWLGNAERFWSVDAGAPTQTLAGSDSTAKWRSASKSLRPFAVPILLTAIICEPSISKKKISGWVSSRGLGASFRPSCDRILVVRRPGMIFPWPIRSLSPFPRPTETAVAG